MTKARSTETKGIANSSGQQPAEKEKTKYLRLAVLLTLVGIFAVLERITFHDVYRTSIEHQKYLRSISHEKIDHLLEIFCEMGQKPGIVIGFLLAANSFNIGKTFVLGVATGLCLIAVQTLKPIYSEPRPFYVSDLVPYLCRFEHGNPSGHTIIAIGFFGTLTSLYLKGKDMKSTGVRLITLAYYLIAFLIAYARIHVGVHTYNQVVNGAVWGYLIYELTTNIFYQHLINFQESFDKKTTFQLFFNWLTVSYGLLYSSMYMYFVLHVWQSKTPESWFVQINKNCKNVSSFPDPKLQDWEVFNTTLILIGSYIGTVLERKAILKNPLAELKDKSYWVKNLIAFLFLPLALVGMILSSSKEPNYFKKVLFRGALIGFFGGIYLVHGQKVA